MEWIECEGFDHGPRTDPGANIFGDREVLTGRAGHVDVTLTPDGGVRIADDGPGIPVEPTGDPHEPDLEALLTRLSPGPAPVGRLDPGWGWAGIGPCVANALSARLTAEVHRAGVRWTRAYERGVAVTPLTEEGEASGTGTVLTLWPDAEIFTTTAYSFDTLADRFRELAFLYRPLEITLTDRRHPGETRSLRFRSTGGARDLVAFLDRQGLPPGGPDVIAVEREDARMSGTLEVALRWRDTGEARIRGYANSHPTPHGTHVQGLRDGLAAAVTAYARERRLPAEASPDLDADRITDRITDRTTDRITDRITDRTTDRIADRIADRLAEGLTAVVSVKMDGPAFEGAIRDRLGNTPVRACVAEAVRDRLGAWLAEHPERAAALVARALQG